jgi:hypothetical protein
MNSRLQNCITMQPALFKLLFRLLPKINPARDGRSKLDGRLDLRRNDLPGELELTHVL